jgi:hypothetical protein
VQSVIAQENRLRSGGGSQIADKLRRVGQADRLVAERNIQMFTGNEIARGLLVLTVRQRRDPFQNLLAAGNAGL